MSTLSKGLSIVALAVAAEACVAGVGPAPVSSSEPPPEPSAEWAESAPDQGMEPPGSCGDPGERDFGGEFEVAVPVEATSTTVGCITRGDVDVFSISVPAGGGGSLFRVRLRGESQMAARIRLFDANRKRLLQAWGRQGEDVIGWISAAPGSQLYAQVDQIHGVDDSYVLSLESAPLGETGEPNDGPEAATALPERGAVEGFMANLANSPEALVDWYRIEVSSPGTLRLDIDMSQDIAPVAELRDANRKRVARKSGGKSERIQLEATVKRGTYLLELKSLHGVDVAAQGEPPSFLTRPYRITAAR
jgi:hypothetical protein